MICENIILSVGRPWPTRLGGGRLASDNRVFATLCQYESG
jgi:hypothetical protein